MSSDAPGRIAVMLGDEYEPLRAFPMDEKDDDDLEYVLAAPADAARAALERIIAMCDVPPTCTCGRPNGLPAVVACALAALEAYDRAAPTESND